MASRNKIQKQWYKQTHKIDEHGSYSKDLKFILCWYTERAFICCTVSISTLYNEN